jgi:hypothetical protein
MLILAGSNDKLSLITSAAGDIDVTASWLDLTNTDPPVVKGSTSGTQLTTITTATTTDIVAAPAGTDRRNLKHVGIRNTHATSVVDVTVQINRSGGLTEQHKATLKPGDLFTFVEGVGWYFTPAVAQTTLIRVLSADDATLANVATAQQLFPTNGALNLAIGTYKIEALITISRAAGVTSHTTSILFAGSATVAGITYQAKTEVGETDLLLPVSRVIGRSTAAQQIKAASTTATEQISIDLDGIVRISAAGTFIPQFIYSVAPGGAPTIKAQSYFIATPLGDNAFTTQGSWT